MIECKLSYYTHFHIDNSIDIMCRKIQGLSKEENLKDAIFSDLQ